MQQLIYTSAPRLLESGKTGFGTVSCSRGMPKPLISYLERISTFDREAGVSSLDYYSCFRMGSVRFHVFTRVCDAGADYTGRTNHLAQHFVVEEGTIEYTLMLPSTPAGVLMALDSRFMAAWNGQPGYLEGEQTPPSVPTNALYAWQSCTGQSENARWLAASYYLNSCCLSADVSARTALELLHDGLLHRDDHGWGMGLSTAVVSNLSSSAFPITFLSGEQRAVGVRSGAGAHLLSVTTALQPPTEADMPAVVVPMVSVPEPEPLPAAPPAAVMPAPAAQPSHVPPSPGVVTEPIPEAGPQVPPPHTRRRQEKRKGEHQLVLLVAGLSVAALGLVAWNMTDTKEQPKAASPVPPLQTPGPAEQEKKKEMPKITFQPKPAHQEPLKDATAPEKKAPEAETKSQSEQTVPPDHNAEKTDAAPTATDIPADQPLPKEDTPPEKNQQPQQNAKAASPNPEPSPAPRHAEPAGASECETPAPVQLTVPPFRATRVTVQIDESDEIKKSENVEKKLRKEAKTIKVFIYFEGINAYVKESLGGDKVNFYLKNFPEGGEVVEDVDFAKTILNFHQKFFEENKKKKDAENTYKKVKNDFLQKLGKEKREIERLLKEENEPPSFKKISELIVNNEKMKKELSKLQERYHKREEADKACQKAERDMSMVLTRLFKREGEFDVSQRFEISPPGEDGFIEVKTKTIKSESLK